MPWNRNRKNSLANGQSSYGYPNSSGRDGRAGATCPCCKGHVDHKDDHIINKSASGWDKYFCDPYSQTINDPNTVVIK